MNLKGGHFAKWDRSVRSCYDKRCKEGGQGMKAAIYIRVNSESQLGVTQAEKEKEALVEYCRENGIGVAGIYRDYVSRKRGAKEGLSKVADLIKKQEIDCVAVMDYSRISRDLSESLEFFKMANRYGAIVCGPMIEKSPMPEKRHGR